MDADLPRSQTFQDSSVLKAQFRLDITNYPETAPKLNKKCGAA